MEDKKVFLIIDSHALIHRAFHAFPPTLSNSKGEPTNAVYGFAGLLLDVLLKFKPSRVVAVFDSHGPTVRSNEFSGYKANRAETDTMLVPQFKMVYELIRMFDIPLVIQDSIEADDLIGTLDHSFSGKEMQTVIVTGDRDLFQLVDEDTFVYLAGSKFSESKLYNSLMVKEKMGVSPEYITDLKGLSGDASDNIPGVKGIGAKGAADLINKYGSIEKIYANIDQVENRYRQKLVDGYEDANLSKRLATIYKDIPLSFNIDNADFSSVDKSRILGFFKEMQFRSLMSKLDKFFDLYKVSNDEFDLFSVNLPTKEAISIKTWNKGVPLTSELYMLAKIPISDLSPLLWRIESIIVLLDDKTYIVESALVNDFLGMVKNSKIITFDKKPFIHSVLNLGFDIDEFQIEDIAIRAFVVAEGQVKFDYESICNWAGIKLVAGEEQMLLGIKELSEFLNRRNSDKKVNRLVELEDTVMFTTVQMEQNGITLDLPKIESYSSTLSEKLEGLRASIFKSVGHEFNLNSPKQVSDVLFKEKALPINKKTKGGALSTNESVLRSLLGVDPIIELLLIYREVDKLSSTYLRPLPEYVDSDGKIHSIFDQFGAVSGRYSSKNPNLQNIPFSEVFGVNIRNAFISSPGFEFISFDYSQQELRVLAALSGEEIMIDSFNKGDDIHKITASELFGVRVEDVTASQRQVGKTVNFSVIYGISAFGLSERLGINRSTADAFIKKYFEKYPRVRLFLDSTINKARENLFSETVLGRRRVNKMINSSNRALKNAAERELFNFVIQGSAADIMKSSMVSFPSLLDKYGAKIILQIHDEFLFEFPDANSGNKEDFIREVCKVMSGALNLGVDYKVEVSEGRIWGEI